MPEGKLIELCIKMLDLLTSTAQGVSDELVQTHKCPECWCGGRGHTKFLSMYVSQQPTDPSHKACTRIRRAPGLAVTEGT